MLKQATLDHYLTARLTQEWLGSSRSDRLFTYRLQSKKFIKGSYKRFLHKNLCHRVFPGKTFSRHPTHFMLPFTAQHFGGYIASVCSPGLNFVCMHARLTRSVLWEAMTASRSVIPFGARDESILLPLTPSSRALVTYTVFS